jgi:hypothetical protein
LQSSNFENPGRLIIRLVESLKALDPENLEGDDATAVLLQATSSRATFWNSFLAPLRLAGGLLGLRRIGVADATNDLKHELAE